MLDGRHLSKDILAQKLEQIKIEPLDAFHVVVEDKKETLNDLSTSYRMSIIVKGKGKITTSNGNYYVKAGDLLIVAPNIIYTSSSNSDETLETYSVRFTMATNECVKEFISMTSNREVQIFSDIFKEYHVGMLESVFALVQRNDPSAYFFIKTILNQALGLIVYNAGKVTTNKVLSKSKTRSSEYIVMKCSDYMASNPSLNITVEDLCKLCGVSQSYMYKSFMSILGMSTKAFITSTKLKAAEDGLLLTDKSVTEIALENGYPNTYQFSNIFKKAHGISPTEYRKSQRVL